MQRSTTLALTLGWIAPAGLANEWADEERRLRASAKPSGA